MKRIMIGESEKRKIRKGDSDREDMMRLMVLRREKSGKKREDLVAGEKRGEKEETGGRPGH